MKTAVFHNFVDNIGGAERVALTLSRELGADLYTTAADEKQIQRMGFSLPVRSIGWVPVNAPFRQQIAYERFRRLNLKGQYDRYIIAGDWAMSGGVRNKPNLWYVHSPVRELWDLYEYTRRHTVPFWGRPLFDAWVAVNRGSYRRDIRHIQRLVCSSRNAQERVHRYFGREARVIYPPVDLTAFRYGRNGDFWLSVNRLISHKRIAIQLEAFRQMPNERLVLVGSYEKARHFKAYADAMLREKPPNVEIRSWVPQEELVRLYADCRGLIATARDEDFGLTPIEAMAAGKPVIAADEGGYRETVISGRTGLLIPELTAEKIVDAVHSLGPSAASFRETCQNRAADFSAARFIREIREVLEDL